MVGKFSNQKQKGFQLYETKSFKRNGFESVTDANGKIITSIDDKASLFNYLNVGANEVHIDLQVEFEKENSQYFLQKKWAQFGIDKSVNTN